MLKYVAVAKHPDPLDQRSGIDPKREQRVELSSRLQQVGLLTSIPFVLLAGPALGYYLGTALDHHWSHTPWGMTLGIILGLLSSARVTIKLIREAQRSNS